MQTDVLIIGAGLAGMSTSYHLGQKGIDHLLVEASDKAGGLAITEVQDRFHFDITGHWLHLRDEGIKAMVDAVAGLKNFKTVERKTHIFSHGGYTLYPFQSNLYGLPPEVQKDCLKGFVEALCKKEAGKANKNPKNFEQWVITHMGQGIAKHFMIPYNHKLWTVHPRNMTPLWCQIYVPTPGLDEVVDGLVEAPDRKIGYNATFIYPKRGGIGYLSKKLAAALPQKPLYNTAVKRVNLKKKQATLSDGTVVTYKRLVSTAPLRELVKYIENAPKTAKEQVRKLKHQSVCYYNVALDKPANVPGSHWIYVPEKEYCFYRIGFFSNAMSYMAPKGKCSMYVELSHRGGLPKEDTWKQVEADLLKSGLVDRKKDILFHQERNAPYAYVIFDHNYQAVVPKLRSWLTRNNVYSIGRYGRWTYNSMETALIDGREVADEIAKDLT